MRVLDRSGTPDAAWPLLDPRHSLRSRTALLFACAAAVLTLFSAWAGGRLLERQLQLRLGTTFEGLAAQIGAQVQRVLQERHGDLQLVSGLISASPDATPREQRLLLERLVDRSAEFAWIGLAGPDGSVVAGTHGLFQSTQADQQAWYRSGSQGPYVGTVRSISGLPPAPGDADMLESRVIDVAVPVLDASGARVGVLVAYVRWSASHDIVANAVPDSLRENRIGATLYDPTGEPVLDTGTSGGTEPPAAPSIALTGRPRGWLTESTGDGASFVSGYSRFRGAADASGAWIVAVRQPLLRAFAPVSELRRQTLIGGAVVTALFAVLGWISAMPISRQLRRITRAAARINAGDTLAILPAPGGAGELSRASDALRTLVENLRRGEGGSPRPKISRDNGALPRQ